MPVDAWVVPCQPREAEDELEMAKASHLKGEVLGVGAMDTQAGRDVVGDRIMRGSAAINKLSGDGLGMGKRVEIVLNQDRRVQEGV